MAPLTGLVPLVAAALGAAAPPPMLSLDEALAALEERSVPLLQARARAEEAAAVAVQARAPLYPTLSATGSAIKNSAEAKIDLGRLLTLPPGVPRPSPVFIQPDTQLTVGGALRVPLVVPTSWWELSAARDVARAAAVAAEAVRLQARAGLVQGAHLAAAVEELVQASERAVESAAEHERSAARHVAAGTGAPLDALRAQTERIRRESDLAKARADLGRAWLGLGVLIGRDGPVRIAVAAPAAAEPPEAAPLVARALERRPELAAARAQADAAASQVDAARARIAPQLSGTVAAFASDVPYVTGDKWGWRASLDLAWPIYDGGFRDGRREQAAAQLSSARAAEEGARLQVVQDVQDGVRDVAVAIERVRLAEQQRKLATDAAASAKRSYEAGVASSLDVVDANDRLYQADVGQADAHARLGIARAALSRATAEP
jgi:outer membrane protein TolC